MTQCSSIIAGSTMLAALPFLLCYSGLTVALCHQDLRHGLLPDRYTCPLLWSGLLFYLCLAPHQLHDAVWGGDSRLSLFGCDLLAIPRYPRL